MWPLLHGVLLAFAPLPHCSTGTLRPAVHVTAEFGLEPRDELRPRFSRGESETRTEFSPTKTAAPTPRKPAAGSNEALLEEIRALQPKTVEARPERAKVDLNGISPWLLVLGSTSYAAASFLGYQFTLSATEMFNNRPIDPDTFYVVARLSTVARYVVIAMGALGTAVTAFAASGQAALCVQVMIGIARGELDPKAKRIDPYGGRKQGQLEKMLRLALGDKMAGLGIEER